MRFDEKVLEGAVDRIREVVAAHLMTARGPARLSLLRLQDSLDRLRFMLAGGVPLTRRRSWRGDATAIDVGVRLKGAYAELTAALDEASSHMDGALRATLAELAEDLRVWIAGVFGVSRGAGDDLDADTVGQRASVGVASLADRATGSPVPAVAQECEKPRPELVSLSASAPTQARPGDQFVARFAAYLPEDEAGVRQALAQSAPGSRLAVAPKPGGLLRGTEVEISLEGVGLTFDGSADHAAQRFVWEGRPQIVEFVAEVPSAAAPQKLVLKFYVRVAGMVLQRVLLELAVGAVQTTGPTTRREVPGGRLPTTAFASYSSHDRPRVLDRVAAIRIAAGIDVFLDCMDLNPSEMWESRLQGEIDTRDLFILFWSKAAAQSRWVTWEWERALAAKGADAMQIQPLDNGVQPPRPLRAVHMADPYVDLRESELSRRAAERLS